MERTQFTFYESFFKAVSRIKKKADRCDAYDVICEYAMYGKEPDVDSLPDSVAIAFELVRPNLDASRKKAINGKRGGMRKQTESKTEECESKPKANGKQTESKSKKENEIEKEKEYEIEMEIENECSPIIPTSAVLASFANRINPMPTETCRAELAMFERELGPDVCLRAIDIAVDERKTSWAYIRGILKAKKEQGIKSLADWDRAEEAREDRKKAQVSAKDRNKLGTIPGVINRRPDRQAEEDMERMRKYLEQLNGGST